MMSTKNKQIIELISIALVMLFIVITLIYSVILCINYREKTSRSVYLDMADADLNEEYGEEEQDEQHISEEEGNGESYVDHE